MTYVDRDAYHREVNRILNARPFELTALQDAKYAGLLWAVRILDAMPGHECECGGET